MKRTTMTANKQTLNANKLMHMKAIAQCFAMIFAMSSSCVFAATPAEVLATYSSQAGTAIQPARGQQLFTTKHGKEWSCATCHSSAPTVEGKHATTGKLISPLAPAFNAERFTDIAKSDKWFRRNCNDVMGRECTAVEKADVLAWLMTLKK
jgi:mono/diheme cytochrome c family protein